MHALYFTAIILSGAFHYAFFKSATLFLEVCIFQKCVTSFLEVWLINETTSLNNAQLFYGFIGYPKACSSCLMMLRAKDLEVKQIASGVSF